MRDVETCNAIGTTLRVLARAARAIPMRELRGHLPEMRDVAATTKRALPAARLAELDALIDALRARRPARRRGRLRRAVRPRPRAPRCTCSSTCTATRATAARR